LFSTGLVDSDDEDIENDIDQQIESIMAPKRIVKEIKASVAIGGPSKFTPFRKGSSKSLNYKI